MDSEPSHQNHNQNPNQQRPASSSQLAIPPRGRQQHSSAERVEQSLGQGQHQHATATTASYTDRDSNTHHNHSTVGTATASATALRVALSLLPTPGVDSTLLTPGKDRNGNGNLRTRTPSTGSGDREEKEKEKERGNSRSIDGTVTGGTSRDEMSPNRIRTLPTWVSRRPSSSSCDGDDGSHGTPSKQPTTSATSHATHPSPPEPSHRRVPQTSNPGSIHDSQREKTPVTPLPAGAHGQSRWRTFIEDTAMVPPKSRDGPGGLRRVSVAGSTAGHTARGRGGSVAGLSSGPWPSGLSETSAAGQGQSQGQSERREGRRGTVAGPGASGSGYRKNSEEEELSLGKGKENGQQRQQPQRRASISDPLIFSGGETRRIGKRVLASFALYEEERRILGDLGDDVEDRKGSLDHSLDDRHRAGKDSKEPKRYRWKGKDREREKEGGRKLWEYQGGDGSSTGGYDVAYDPESAEEWIMRAAEERERMERGKAEKEKKKEGESWLDGLADLALPWLAGGKAEEGGEGGIMEDRELRELVTTKQKKRNWWQKFYATLLNSPIVPLTCRSIIWLLSLLALSFAANIFHLSLQSNIEQKASTVMAIVVDGIALLYLIYITYDEISGKPLGLRSPNAKIRLIMFDLVFIVFDSANLSLAFDTLFDVRWSCRSFETQAVEKGSPLSMTNSPICQRQKALAAFLFLALGAWILTFTVSVFRVVERVNKGGRQ